MPEPLPSDTLNTNRSDSLPAPVPPFVPPLELPADAATELDLRGYQLLEALGKGGMGEVYRACDPALGRDLAIKVIKGNYRGQAMVEQRFLREARITGSLQHPGIVSIHNLGRLADGRLHYTMRLVRGRTFADILKEEAGRSERWPELLTIFVKICQAVAYAHSKRVIHRDLKPHNVMVGKFGEVQVMDWGLAKLLPQGERDGVSDPSADDDGGTRIVTESADASSELTRMGSGIGTPAYMPPEQALGEWDRVDERSDVFALGAILCEILTGKPPYEGRDVVLQAKRGDVVEALARLEQCGADAALVTLGRDCLSPEREARPREAGVVAQRVAEYQAEVQARLQRAEVERAQAVVKAHEERKRRRLFLASILLLSAVTLLAVWQAVRATSFAKAESEQRQQAEESKADTEAMLGFFRSKVLSAGRPRGQDGGQGVDVKLSEAVDKAEPEIANDFKDRPLVEAPIRDTLGMTYLYLGKPSLAIVQHERSLALFQAQLGPDHRDTLRSQNNLAEAYHEAGLLDKALPLLQQTLEKMKTLHGDDHPDVLQGMNNLAEAYRDTGRMDKAIPLLKEVLEKKKAQLGADHPDTLIGMDNLATAYQEAGQWDKALPLLEQTLERMTSRLGPDHPDTLTCMSGLGLAYKAAGQLDKALPLLEQSLQKRKIVLPTDHPSILTSTNNLALAYRSIGQLGKALPLLEQTLQKRKALRGADHPDTLISIGNLAAAYWSAGKLDRSVPLFEELLQLQTRKRGPDNPETLLTMADLGVNYRDTGRTKEAISLLETVLERGRKQPGGLPPTFAWVASALAQTYERALQFAKAEAIYRDSLAQARKQFAADDPRTAAALAQLGANLLQQKKFADAEPLLRQCLTVRDKKQPDLWATFHTRSALGAALAGQNKYADAEPLLVQGYEGLKERQDKIPPLIRRLRLDEARLRLVQLYEAWGKKDEADKWRKTPAD